MEQVEAKTIQAAFSAALAMLTAYFGIVERFSVFAAVGFNAVLGWYLFEGFNIR